MSKKFAIIIGELVDGIALAENPLSTGHLWVDITDLNPKPSPGWTYVGGIFYAPPESPKPPKIYNRLQLIDALGTSYNSIISASKTDVEIEVWLEKFRLKEIFVSTDNAFIEDMNFLVTKNLITQEKADSILQ